jgi:NADH:ubiquinone oxidoreductase subunit 4 (subunit M)
MYQRVFFGKIKNAKNEHVADMSGLEKAALWPTAVAALVMGVAPILWLKAIDPAMHSLLQPFTQMAARVVGR